MASLIALHVLGGNRDTVPDTGCKQALEVTRSRYRDI